MWQWTDGTGELYHYGVKGMRWGHRKAKVYAEGASKKTFKSDLKKLRSRNGIKTKFDYDENGNLKIKGVYSSDGKFRGEKYAWQLMDANNKRNARRRVASLVGTAAVLAGASYVNSLR